MVVQITSLFKGEFINLTFPLIIFNIKIHDIHSQFHFKQFLIMAYLFTKTFYNYLVFAL